MSKRNKNENKSPRVRFIEIAINICTVIICIISIGFLMEFASEYRYVARSPYRSYTFEYETEDGEYARLSQYVTESRPYGKPGADVREYFALGDYFYCSTMTTLCDRLGEEELFKYWNTKKDEAAKDTGSLSSHIAKIDERLERR